MRQNKHSLSNFARLALGSFTAGLIALIALSAQPARAGGCKAPRVLVILDKSSSMLGDAGGQTKWDVAKTALDTLLKTYDTSADFGLMLFPSPSQCGPGKVVVNIGANTATSILAQLASPPPATGNWTPMAQSLDVAPQSAGLQDASYPRHVLLITDGWQWCSPYANSSRFLPVNSVTQLKQLGITTHVVGFGASVDALTLNKMADAAGTQRQPTCDPTGSDPSTPNPCYYQANNVTELSAALDAIAKKITQEICDGEDNDCNGTIDDALTGSLCPQQQGVCAGTRRTCQGSAGWSAMCTPTDYEDNAKTLGKAYQANETLCDGVDNDCDGTIDEGCACKDGETRACGSDKGICHGGTQRCVAGTWSGCEGEIPPVAELCDGLDNDCDGTIDEKLTRACTSACGTGTETCAKGTYGGCTAPQPSAEICDGLDNDCDGTVDGANAVCENGGTCIDAHCQTTKIGGGGAGGCDCQLGDSESTFASALPLALLLLGFFLLRRRVR
ncbi:MAG: VWA domain-containing protein [Deltaproteobacteria bacterium]|nr:VWA domain-containing protein [Deltaproteobacteria bacterium]